MVIMEFLWLLWLLGKKPKKTKKIARARARGLACEEQKGRFIYNGTVALLAKNSEEQSKREVP